MSIEPMSHCFHVYIVWDRAKPYPLIHGISLGIVFHVWPRVSNPMLQGQRILILSWLKYSSCLLLDLHRCIYIYHDTYVYIKSSWYLWSPRKLSRLHFHEGMSSLVGDVVKNIRCYEVDEYLVVQYFPFLFLLFLLISEVK